ncbi:MAG: hypothetical protein K2X66_02930 [Cyanobacteria bacterium]|nr:hypothetical protein [Cyanobacteriota bacterium]
MLIICSSLIILILAIGFIQRHNTKIHVPFMLTAFASDVLLVLVIELSRSAIEKASHQLDNPFLMFHISVSLLSLALYTALSITGFKLLKGNETLRPLHKKLSGAFIVCRLANYITSFWVVEASTLPF